MDAHYRVVIFGSARTREGDPIYKDIFYIAQKMAESGFDIVTGGGPGIMLAANEGHKSVKSGSHSIGLNIRLPLEQEPNKYLDVKKDFERFSDRLDTFMSLSDAVVVAPGGIGTILELFYTWQLMQVRHICEMPIILYGDIWTTLLSWLENEVLERGLFDKKDMHNLFQIGSPEQVVQFIHKVHEDRSKMEHVCVNYDLYRMDLM